MQRFLLYENNKIWQICPTYRKKAYFCGRWLRLRVFARNSTPSDH